MPFLDRAQMKAHVIQALDKRFPSRKGTFKESTTMASLPFPSPASLRTWGMKLNDATWYIGWFTPSEFLGCATVGKIPDGKYPNLIDLMYRTQGRPVETTPIANELFRMARDDHKPRKRRT